jgi:hypothetical protein
LGLTNLAQKTLVEEHLIQHCNCHAKEVWSRFSDTFRAY